MGSLILVGIFGGIQRNGRFAVNKLLPYLVLQFENSVWDFHGGGGGSILVQGILGGFASSPRDFFRF